MRPAKCEATVPAKLANVLGSAGGLEIAGPPPVAQPGVELSRATTAIPLALAALTIVSAWPQSYESGAGWIAAHGIRIRALCTPVDTIRSSCRLTSSGERNHNHESAKPSDPTAAVSRTW